jgi:Ran GTPase-activating protein (RanGAP) involved in mRNA processing and transport
MSVEAIDLSGNKLTERCFDAIETCLTINSKIKTVNLSGINVKSNFAWGKFKRFGSIVKH